MTNEKTVHVYNYQDVEARDILSLVRSSDINREDGIPCLLRVHVSDAYFTDQTTRNGLHRPYLVMKGYVAEIITAGNEPFPCHSDSMTLMTPQSVKISYVPTSEELAVLVNKGLFYEDFEPPAALVGNIMEIHAKLSYIWITNTNVIMVDVMSPYNIETYTRLNEYDGFFDGCEIVQDRIIEDSDKYQPSLHFYGVNSLYRKPYAHDYFEDDKTGEIEVGSFEHVVVDEDQRFTDALANVFSHNDDEMSAKLKTLNATTPDRTVAIEQMKKEMEATKQKEMRDRNKAKDAYVQLSESGSQSKEQQPVKLRYESFVELVSMMEAKKNSDSNAGNASVEKDDLLNFAQDTKTPAGQEPKPKNASERGELSAKKDRETIMRTDIANDNKALNEAAKLGIEADTSGFGATLKPVDMSQPLTFGAPPSSSGSAARKLGGLAGLVSKVKQDEANKDDSPKNTPGDGSKPGSPEFI